MSVHTVSNLIKSKSTTSQKPKNKGTIYKQLTPGPNIMTMGNVKWRPGWLTPIICQCRCVLYIYIIYRGLYKTSCHILHYFGFIALKKHFFEWYNHLQIIINPNALRDRYKCLKFLKVWVIMSSTTQTFKLEFNLKTGKQGILKYLFIPGIITIQMNFASSSNFNSKCQFLFCISVK